MAPKALHDTQWIKTKVTNANDGSNSESIPRYTVDWQLRCPAPAQSLRSPVVAVRP